MTDTCSDQSVATGEPRVGIVQELDGVSFGLREEHEFDWLHDYGRVFCVFDQ